MDDEAGVDASLQGGQDLATTGTSSPSPSSTMTRWTAVQGKALEANTTREYDHRTDELVGVLASARPERALGHDQHRGADLVGERRRRDSRRW